MDFTNKPVSLSFRLNQNLYIKTFNLHRDWLSMAVAENAQKLEGALSGTEEHQNCLIVDAQLRGSIHHQLLITSFLMLYAHFDEHMAILCKQRNKCKDRHSSLKACKKFLF